MAKLSKSFSPAAHDVRTAWEEDRRADAKHEALKHYHVGNRDEEFLDLIVALWLETKPRKRGKGRGNGGKRKTVPALWFEIGEAFEALTDENDPGHIGFEEAYNKLDL
jgi:hypothetical protein